MVSPQIAFFETHLTEVKCVRMSMTFLSLVSTLAVDIHSLNAKVTLSPQKLFYLMTFLRDCPTLHWAGYHSHSVAHWSQKCWDSFVICLLQLLVTQWVDCHLRAADCPQKVMVLARG